MSGRLEIGVGYRGRVIRQEVCQMVHHRYALVVEPPSCDLHKPQNVVMTPSLPLPSLLSSLPSTHMHVRILDMSLAPKATSQVCLTIHVGAQWFNKLRSG